MANNVYIVDQLATGTETITVNDDGSGIDWIVIQGVYSLATDIRLGHGYPPSSTSGSGFYYNPGNWGHRLIVVGLIENARGSNGTDYIQGNELGNLLYGDASNVGPGGADTIDAADGNDTVFGGAGNDTINAADGNDLLFGDAGNDTLSGNYGADTLVGGAGADSMSGGSDGTDWVFYTTSPAAVDVRLISGDTSTSYGGDAQGDRIHGVNHVRGSAFNDRITDQPESNFYNTNRFDGMDGHDYLKMGGGNDTAYGGNGNDTIEGATGNDRLYGEAGGDRIYAGAGNDTVFGGDGYNLLDGGAENDRVVGGALRETLYGGTGEDTLLGNGGDDLFFGGTGRDRLLGGAGNDTLIGGGGKDRLIGGAGADHFKFIARSESGPGATTRDVIEDFRRLQGDKINFDQLIATGDFIGRAAFGHNAGEVRFITTTTGSRALFDMDGDGRADMSVDVLGVSTLRASDFIL